MSEKSTKSPAETLTCGHPNAGRRGPNGECAMIVGKKFCDGKQR